MNSLPNLLKYISRFFLFVENKYKMHFNKHFKNLSYAKMKKKLKYTKNAVRNVWGLVK
jgi:hypothetical protein